MSFSFLKQTIFCSPVHKPTFSNDLAVGVLRLLAISMLKARHSPGQAPYREALYPSSSSLCSCRKTSVVTGKDEASSLYSSREAMLSIWNIHEIVTGTETWKGQYSVKVNPPHSLFVMAKYVTLNVDFSKLHYHWRRVKKWELRSRNKIFESSFDTMNIEKQPTWYTAVSWGSWQTKKWPSLGFTFLVCIYKNMNFSEGTKIFWLALS